MKIVVRYLKREEGFWSAMAILFLVTLGLMGLGASALMRNEGSSAIERAEAMQADYAANGAAYFGIERLSIGALDESQTYAIGSASVTLDTTIDASSGYVLLTVTGVVGGTDRSIQIEIIPGGKLADKAIYTEGQVYNVSAKDSTGTEDSSLLVKQVDNIPEFDEAALAAMSTAQGHDQTAAIFKPADGYPDGSFYQADGVTPNVTHVMNDFQVLGGRDIYGIFVVEGDVVLNGSSRINGVIYLPNPTSTIIHGGGDPTESTITGGIVSHGDISGTGNHISVQHWPEFMRVFCNWQTGGDPPGAVLSWTYF